MSGTHSMDNSTSFNFDRLKVPTPGCFHISESDYIASVLNPSDGIVWLRMIHGICGPSRTIIPLDVAVHKNNVKAVKFMVERDYPCAPYTKYMAPKSTDVEILTLLADYDRCK
jgi:hypothetical protein